MIVPRERVKAHKWWIAAVCVVALVGAAMATTSVAAERLRGRYNRVLKSPPYRASAAATNLHERLVVVDLHADTLLWTKNVLQQSSRGHVDIPRLQKANVAVQAFTVVTKVPKNQNIEFTRADDDQFGYLAAVEGWPPDTWKSSLNRALYQASNLRHAEEQSGGQFVILRTAGDLQRVMNDRATTHGTLGGLLGLEGAHALQGDLANLDRLYDAGYRMVGFTHFFDNEYAGASSGVSKHGITSAGEELLRRAEGKRILIDLAHASHQTIMDVTRLASRPVVVSHAGVKGTCNNNRNLSDEELRAVARTGGLVGIGYWRTATCGADADAVARAIRYAANVIGTEHIALGSDFDGAATQPFDATGLVLITQALLAHGFSEVEIRQIMGGNAVRLLSRILPAE